MPEHPWRERLVRRIVEGNNRRVGRADPGQPNPRMIEQEPWWSEVTAAHARVRAEWERFAGGGGRLPLIDEVLGGNQGSVGGPWWSGPLIARRRPVGPLPACFPDTVEVLLGIPGLLSATWSVLGPSTELPLHQGINAGALNFLIGVDCHDGSGHEISGTEVALTGGNVVVFDDTEPHAAWNRSDRPRVALMGDLLRPVPGWPGRMNAVVQGVTHHLSPSYGRAVDVASRRLRELNPDLARAS